MNPSNRRPTLLLGVVLLAACAVVAVLVWRTRSPDVPTGGGGQAPAFGVTLHFRAHRLAGPDTPGISMGDLVAHYRRIAAAGGFADLRWEVSGAADGLDVTVPMTADEFSLFATYAAALADAIGGQPVDAGALEAALADRDADKLAALAGTGPDRAEDIRRLVEAWGKVEQADAALAEARRRLAAALQARMAAAPDAREQADNVYAERRADADARAAQCEQAARDARAVAGSLLWTGKRLEGVLLHTPEDRWPALLAEVAAGRPARRQKLVQLAGAYRQYAAHVAGGATVPRLRSLLTAPQGLALRIAVQTAVEEDEQATISAGKALAAVKDLTARGPDHVVTGDGACEGERLGWFPVPAGRAGNQTITGTYDGRLYVLLCLSRRRSMATADDPWRVREASARLSPHSGRAQILVKLDDAGGALLRRITRDHLNCNLAIVVGGAVNSVPVIRDEIGSQILIDGGGMTLDQARQVAAILTAEAPPVRLELQSVSAFETRLVRGAP